MICVGERLCFKGYILRRQYNGAVFISHPALGTADNFIINTFGFITGVRVKHSGLRVIHRNRSVPITLVKLNNKKESINESSEEN